MQSSNIFYNMLGFMFLTIKYYIKLNACIQDKQE